MSSNMLDILLAEINTFLDFKNLRDPMDSRIQTPIGFHCTCRSRFGLSFERSRIYLSSNQRMLLFGNTELAEA